MLNSRRPLKPPPKVIPPTYHNSNNRQSKHPNESLITESEDNTNNWDKDSSRKESKIFPLDVDVPDKYLSSSFDFEEAVQQEMKRLELEFLSQLEPQDVKKNSNMILKSDINRGKIHINDDISITSPKVDNRNQQSYVPQEINDNPHARRNSYEMQKQHFEAPDFINNQKKYSPISETIKEPRFHTAEFQHFQQPKIQEPAFMDPDAAYQRNNTNNSHPNQYATPAKINSVTQSPQGSSASIISNSRNRNNPNDMDDNKARKRRQQEEYRRELEKQMYEADLTKQKQKEIEDRIDSERMEQHQQLAANSRMPIKKSNNSTNLRNGSTTSPPKQYPNNISPTPVSIPYSNDGRYQQQNGTHSSLSGNNISYNDDMNDIVREGHDDSFRNRRSGRGDGSGAVGGRDDPFQQNNNQRPYVNDKDSIGMQRLRISSPYNANEKAANSTLSPQKSNQARQRMLNDVFGGSNSPTKTDITNDQSDSNKKWRPSMGTVDGNRRQAMLEQRAALEEQVQETRRRKEDEKRRQRQEEEDEERRIQQEIQAAEDLKKQTKLAKQKELQQVSMEESQRHDVAIADRNARRRGGAAVAAVGGFDANGFTDDNQSHNSNSGYTSNNIQSQHQSQTQYQRSSPMKPNADYHASDNAMNIPQPQPMNPSRRAVPLGALHVDTGGSGDGRSSGSDGRGSVARGRAPADNYQQTQTQEQSNGYMAENGYRDFGHYSNNASNYMNDYQQPQPQPYPQSQQYPPRYAIPHQQPISMYPGCNFQDNSSYGRNSNSRLNGGFPYGPNHHHQQQQQQQQPYSDDPLQELRSVSSMSNYTSQTQTSTYMGGNPTGRQSSMTVDDPSQGGRQLIHDSRRILPAPLERIQNEPPVSLMSLIDENARLASGGTGDLEAYVEDWQRRNGYHGDVVEGNGSQQHRQDRRLYEDTSQSNKSQQQHQQQYLNSPNRINGNASNRNPASLATSHKPDTYPRSSSRYEKVHVDVEEAEEDFGEVSFVSESRFVPSVPVPNGNLFDNNLLSKNNNYSNENLIRNSQKNYKVGNNGSNIYNRENATNKYSGNSLTFSSSPGKISKPLTNNRSNLNTNATTSNPNLEKSLASDSCLLFHSTANANITDSMSYFFTNNLIDCVDNKTKDSKVRATAEGTKDLTPTSKRYSPVNTNINVNKLDSQVSPHDSSTKLSISTAPGTPLSKLLNATFRTEVVSDSLLFNVSDTYDEEKVRRNLGFNHHDNSSSSRNNKMEVGNRGSLQTSGSLQTNGVLKPSRSTSRPSTVGSGSGSGSTVRHRDVGDGDGGEALLNLVGVGGDAGVAARCTGRREAANNDNYTTATSTGDRAKIHRDVERPRSVAAILQSVDMYRDVCNFGDPVTISGRDVDLDDEESELHVLNIDAHGRPRTAAGSKKTNFTDLDNSLDDSQLFENDYDNESFEGSEEEILVVPAPAAKGKGKSGGFHGLYDGGDLDDDSDSFLPTTTTSSTSSSKKFPFQIHTLTEYDQLAIQGKREREKEAEKRKPSK